MENTETLATLGPQDTGRRKTKHRKLNIWAARTPPESGVGVNLCARAIGKQFLPLIRNPIINSHVYSLTCVLWTQCCQCLCIFHSWLHSFLRFSLTFIFFKMNYFEFKVMPTKTWNIYNRYEHVSEALIK
jgi:hypothetical protein